MKFYIVDDDQNIVLILKNIIKKQSLGTVIGSSNDGRSAYKEILEEEPDIVLIDYLMPKLDGASLVKSLSDKNIRSRFIMISQVDDPHMVSEVYKEGVEFFIHKPLNIVEVQSIIQSVCEKISLMKKFDMLKGIVNQDFLFDESKPSKSDSLNIDNIKKILSQIGILGEKGTDDIIRVCQLKSCEKHGNSSLTQICSHIGSNPKVVKQRMRRTMLVGLKNLSHMGIEDNLNEYFLRYSNTLYDFESIRFEMEHIRGKSNLGGRVHIEKFIENLILHSTEY